MSNPIAVIDVGTNTLRLLVANMQQGALVPVYEQAIYARLGQGLQQNGSINPDAWERGLNTYKQLVEIAKSYGASPIIAAATLCLRKAANGADFALKAARLTGVNLHILSGQQEALVSSIGVKAGLSISGTDALIIDSGGGSTELIATTQNTVDEVSLPLGALTLTEQFLTSDPPTTQQLTGLQNHCALILQKQAVSSNTTTLIAAGGSATTLAAINLQLKQYQAQLVQGHIMPIAKITAILNNLAGLTLAQRQNVTGLEAPRAGIIVAGVTVLQQVCLHYKAKKLIISDYGLRQGLVVLASQNKVSATNGLLV